MSFFLCEKPVTSLGFHRLFLVHQHRAVIIDLRLLFQGLAIWVLFAKKPSMSNKLSLERIKAPQDSKKSRRQQLLQNFVSKLNKKCFKRHFLQVLECVGNVFANFRSSGHQVHNSNTFELDKILWTKTGKSLWHIHAFTKIVSTYFFSFSGNSLGSVEIKWPGTAWQALICAFIWLFVVIWRLSAVLEHHSFRFQFCYTNTKLRAPVQGNCTEGPG